MPLMATAVDTESPTRVGRHRLVKYGLLAVLVAVIANALVRIVVLSVVTAPAGFWPLGWGPVIASTAVGAVGATIVYGVITRVSHRPNRTFTVVAAVALVLSFVSFVSPPPVLAAAPASMLAALAVMHVVGAVAIVGVLTRATKNVDMAEESP
jgi:hypothetical protein